MISTNSEREEATAGGGSLGADAIAIGIDLVKVFFIDA